MINIVNHPFNNLVLQASQGSWARHFTLLVPRRNKFKEMGIGMGDGIQPHPRGGDIASQFIIHKHCQDSWVTKPECRLYLSPGRMVKNARNIMPLHKSITSKEFCITLHDWRETAYHSSRVMNRIK